MTAVVLRGDARRLPLPDGCADLIVTSPPYFGLRSYTDNVKCLKCIDLERDGRDPRQAWPDYDAHVRRDHVQHYDGQIGSEASPGEWVAALVACTAEWVRVLKPSGSLFINLGDKYASAGGAQRQGTDGQMAERAIVEARRRNIGEKALREDTGLRRSGDWGTPNKSLIGLPWRYALACMDELGLILRRDIIWSKPNGLPESVTDRCRSSHEYLFHFTRLPRYYAAVDEIREPQASVITASGAVRYRRPGESIEPNAMTVDANRYVGTGMTADVTGAKRNPLGKLPGSVWEIRAGEPTVRLILRAVADGALTIDEAERLMKGILWTGSTDSTPGSSAPIAAGTGPASPTTRATGRTAAPETDSAAFTGSPTSSGSDPSRTGSPSTTAATPASARGRERTAFIEGASTLPTSSLSPSPRTSGEDVRPPSPLASTGTTSPPRTPMSEPTGTASAGPACETECEYDEDVWSIPSQPLSVPARLGVDHFAAFPMELPRRVILGWSPPGVCTACGEGRRPVATPTADYQRKLDASKQHRDGAQQGWGAHGGSQGGFMWHVGQKSGETSERVITGYACACPDATAPTRPTLVVDPFGGTGTTALVASMLGRTGVSVDLSADYCRLARWRTTDPGERARALLVPKPPPVPDGQGSLFDDLEAS